MQSTQRSRSRLRWLAVPVLVGLIAASCGGDDDDASPDATADDVVDGGDDATGPDDGGDDDTAPDDTADTADAGGDGDDGGDSGAGAVDDDTADGSPVVVTLAPEVDDDPVVGGTMRFGLEADVNGLNPSTSSLSAPGLTMANAAFDTVAALNTDGVAVPYLAESFTPNDDFTVWTVKLREGITFHDGTPLDAEALAVNYQAKRDHGLVGLAVKPLTPDEGAVTVVDELTAEFTLLDGNAYWPATMATQIGLIASPTWLAAAAADPTLNQAPVGTGPFVYDSRSEDSVTRFVRNDNYWAGEVYLDAVEFYPVPDPSTRVDLLLGGELDGLQTTDAAAILDLQDDDSIQNVLDDSGEESFAMINASAAPFDDIRARQALAHATPIQNYLDLIGLGAFRKANQRFIPESPYHNPDVAQVGDDPDTAVAFAAEYCAERGTEINPVTGSETCTDGKINIEYQWAGPSVVGSRIADMLDQGWSAAFNVTYDELLQDEHINQTAFGQYNVTGWRQFGGGDPAPDNIWTLCRTIGPISLNWPRYCNEERDAVLLAAQVETDPEARAELYQQAEQMFADDYTYIFYHHTMWDIAVTEDVRNLCGRMSPEGDLLACTADGRTWFTSVWMD